MLVPPSVTQIVTYTTHQKLGAFPPEKSRFQPWIADIARETRVPLVDRFDAMRKLQHERGAHFDLAADDLHMNDEGYSHLAKHVAGTIIAGMPQAAAGNLAAARQ